MVLRRMLLLSGALLALACDDDAGPQRPAEVVMTPEAVTLVSVGETAQLTAEPRTSGGRVLEGLAVTWESRNQAVATVSPGGLVTAVGPGPVSVRAVAAGVTGRASVTVDPVVTALEGVVGDGQSGRPGQDLETRPTVRATDARGNPVSGALVTFSVVSGAGVARPATAYTGGDGRASVRWTLGPDAGAAQVLRARTGGHDFEFVATASAGGPEITTAVLDEGRETVVYAARIEATGGSGSEFEWSVTGGALPPGIDLAPDGTLTGTPTAQGTFTFTSRVTDGLGATATRVYSLRVCEPPVSLSPGSVTSLLPAPFDDCGLMLPAGSAGDRYRVAVVRTTPSELPHPASVLFRVRGSQTGSGGAAATAAVGPPDAHLDPGLEHSVRVAEATGAFHADLRGRERQLFSVLGRPSLAAPDRGTGAAAVAGPAAPARRSFQIDFSPTCQAGPPYPAVLLGESDELVIYQDERENQAAPVHPRHVQMMLDYYRDFGAPAVAGYFGEMPDVDGNGRINVLVTPAVPDGIAAFVWAGDLLSRRDCPASNGMELMYLSARVIAAMDGDEPSFQVLATLAHEAKHISSLHNALRRAPDGSGFHPTWIEEGTAEIAGEMSSRIAWAANGGPAVGEPVTGAHFGPPGGAVNVDPHNYGVLLRLARTIWFLTSQPNAVTNNPDGSQTQGHSFYGSSWHFHRFLGDAYGDARTPMADGALFEKQNRVETAAGTDAYPSLVGKDFPQLLEEFAAAIMLNGTGAPQPEHTFTTYDFVTATDILDPAHQPVGAYPWPVTRDAGGNPSAPFRDAMYTTPLGAAGVQIYDFESDGTGGGAVINVMVPQPARLVVVRVR